jgi:hypothetical protein
MEFSNFERCAHSKRVTSLAVHPAVSAPKDYVPMIAGGTQRAVGSGALVVYMVRAIAALGELSRCKRSCGPCRCVQRAWWLIVSRVCEKWRTAVGKTLAAGRHYGDGRPPDYQWLSLQLHKGHQQRCIGRQSLPHYLTTSFTRKTRLVDLFLNNSIGILTVVLS